MTTESKFLGAVVISCVGMAFLDVEENAIAYLVLAFLICLVWISDANHRLQLELIREENSE